MRYLVVFVLLVCFVVFGVACGASLEVNPVTKRTADWVIDAQADWVEHTGEHKGVEIREGMVSAIDQEGMLSSKVKVFDAKRSAASITIEQSPVWMNWTEIANIGPVNLRDAPVMLSLGPDNYWMFGRYGSGRGRGSKSRQAPFKPEAVKLDEFDIPLTTTRFANQYDAAGGRKPKLGGYHAWQSKDMVNWVHHGPITDRKSAWMTSAEWANGKAYFYYDFPNDQDPHVYVDADLFDGEPGDNKGIAYDDPTHGSDSGIIRDLDGKFHLIIEDWSPINAQRHAWDSPLAAHAVSPDGVRDFRALAPPVDERTKPTGKIGTYRHPHWVKENPERFKTNIAKYEIHEPEQNAYGDWAAIAVGGQYYLFCDFDPANSKNMSVGWFTSKSIYKPFKWCGNIGRGHPDPDIMFAEGKFYLATQQKVDFVSPGPWVEEVEVRVGVDKDKDGKIDKWTGWAKVKERYDYIKGFAKQVAKTPARLDLSGLPDGYGFQFQVKLRDTTENRSKPILDKVTLRFRDGEMK